MNPIKLKYANPEQFIAEIDGICRNQLHVFRGKNFIYEHVSSSIYRKYARHFLRDDKLLPLDVEKEIVERARKVLYAESTPIPEILTDIRHFGGDTTLIDFTRSLPVALFFCCNGRFDADGRIIAVPAKRIPQKFSLKHYEASFEAEEEEKEKISEKDRMEYSEAEKKMSFLNPSRTFSSRARTEFQSSIFIHAPKGYLDEAESGYVSIILPKKAKRECLQFLDRCHNIRHDTIYNDLIGYIENEKNTKNSSHWFYFGLSRLRRGEYEKAIKCFNRSIFHNPKNGSVWYYRGRANSALGKTMRPYLISNELVS